MRPRKMGGEPARRGWLRSRRASSPPAYPLTPAMAVRSGRGKPLEWEGSVSVRGVRRSTNVAFNPRFERAGLPFVRADDEDGIVAGDGADDLRPVFIVYRCGDGLGGAGGGDKDEQVGGLAGFKSEAAKHLTDAGALIVV